MACLLGMEAVLTNQKVWYGILGFNVPLDTVFSETGYCPKAVIVSKFVVLGHTVRA